MATEYKNAAPEPEPENKRNGVTQEISRPLLSICLPSYKRADHLEAQILSIIHNIINDERYNIEVIAINNCSPDDTIDRLKRFNHPRLRIVNREIHLDTAEENLFRSLPFANGEYVWFLGDDDVIHTVNFDAAYQLLTKNVYDLILFNSALISNSGQVLSLQPMPMNGPTLTTSMPTLVETVGMLYTLAGVSNVIQRTSKMTVESGLYWLGVSKIYSHVAWMVDRHRDSHVMFVNSPLVFYRQNDYSTGHWEKVAKDQNVQNLYFWSLGLVRLLAQLIDRGALKPVAAGLIFELAADGSRYRLIDDIVFKTFQQIELWVKTGEDRQKFSSAELEEIIDLCLRCDPMLFDIARALRRGYRALASMQSTNYLHFNQQIIAEFSQEFMTLYRARQSAGQFFSRYASRIQNYEVYNMPSGFVAVRTGNVGLLEKTLRMVDPQGDGDNIIVGDTLESIDAQARVIVAAKAEAKLSGRDAAQLSTSESPIVTIATPYADELHRIINDNTAALGELLAQNRELAARLTAVYASTSWAVSAPMRGLAHLFGRRTPV